MSKLLKQYKRNRDIRESFRISFDSDDTNESDGFINFYNHATKEERKAIDNTLIYLCGWSFNTLYESSKKL